MNLVFLITLMKFGLVNVKSNINLNLNPSPISLSNYFKDEK